MNKVLIGFLALAGCSTEELGVTPHLLTAQPGCWTPAAPSSLPEPPPAEGDAFAQMMAATRQMAQFQVAFSIQRYALILDAIRADPSADAWSFRPLTASRASGLVTGGEAPPAGTTGTLTIPGRAPALARLVRMDATTTDRSAEHLDVAVEITDEVCTSENVCTQSSVTAHLHVTAALSTLELPDQVIAWNDDYVSIRSRFSANPLPFDRGCDPATGNSFERRVGMVSAPTLAITSELACWDAAGAAIACGGVDLTPGA